MESDNNREVLEETWDDAVDVEEVKAMASVFATLLTSSSDLDLSSRTHAQGKILWEQKVCW